MMLDSRHEDRLDRIEQRLRCCQVISREAMSELIAAACVRSAALNPAAKASLERLIEAGAWVDAALALVALELPQWKLRRLVYADGEWLCSLSRQPNLPLELDDSAEGNHESLPMAILMALVAARRTAPATATRSLLPRVSAGRDWVVCCDDFA